jgi:phage tail tape-measure protein
MRGNHDRRGPRDGHAQVLDKLRDSAVRGEGNASLAFTSLREVIEWLDKGQVTGYFPTERDEAGQALLAARDAARLLAKDIDSALAAMRSISLTKLDR